MHNIILWQKLFCLSWFEIQNSCLKYDRTYFCHWTTATMYPSQTGSEISQFLLVFSPILYWYRIYCSDKSESAVCDKIWTIIWTKHLTFQICYGFKHELLFWGPQKRVNFHEKFWASLKYSEILGENTLYGIQHWVGNHNFSSKLSNFRLR
jgi:hypothetical protein